ncbi:hypothetical protein FEM03_13495 [Phragmitibacter flavus]|uniref:Uncharacterized protein n=1 Tax=Phragmitibacter flavus TaxID=2576071 RepID=A0A5R8KF21_9BACT|nr:hypothetical protein [Phragmitibacter flavus]TLD70199.1 hypothetical protein FEM03_13495 [Phragmitibacter flavus]
MPTDPILETLINIVEARHADGRPPLGLRLMITVGGMFISGVVVSRGIFLSQERPLLNIIHEAHEGATLEMAIALDVSPSSLERIHPQFLHLANASFSGPSGDWDPPPEDSVEFWRGPLERIDGFTLGESFRSDSEIFPCRDERHKAQ